MCNYIFFPNNSLKVEFLAHGCYRKLKSLKRFRNSCLVGRSLHSKWGFSASGQILFFEAKMPIITLLQNCLFLYIGIQYLIHSVGVTFHLVNVRSLGTVSDTE